MTTNVASSTGVTTTHDDLGRGPWRWLFIGALAATVAACGGGSGTSGSGGSSGGNSSGETGGVGNAGTGGRVSTGGSPGSGGISGTGGGSGGGSGGSANPGSGGLGSTGSGGSSAGGAAGAGGRDGQGAGGASAGGRGGAGNGGAGGAQGGASGASGTGGGGTSGGNGGAGDVVPSAGCGKTPTLKNSPSSTTFTPNVVTVSGTSRQYVIRWPTSYDSSHPYRLILDLHGYGGSYSETAGENYFGLWSPSNNTTIFVALSAIGGDWRTGDNLGYVDQVLTAVESDLCIDKSRIMLEGFSQGAAETWSIACSRPGVFRAAIGHSGGGVTNPTTCKPIPYLGSGGLQESVTQTTQTDQFARWNGCTVTALPTAPTGGHVCTNYSGCPAGDPVRWCNYDGPHTPLPTDSGKTSSWMPSETWPFFSQF